MTVQAARDQYAVRFYQWALSDGQNQKGANFPLLRTIKGRIATRFLRLMTTLSQEDQIKYVNALVKRFHLRGLELTGDLLQPEEEQFCKKVVGFLSQTLPDEPSTLPPLNQQLLSQMVTQRLTAMIGSHPAQLGQLSYRYHIRVGHWNVYTFVEVGGRNRLFYDHRITSDQPLFLQETTSILSWLGISSQTCWDLITNDHINSAADSLTQICKHFLDQAPQLINDLFYEEQV